VADDKLGESFFSFGRALPGPGVRNGAGGRGLLTRGAHIMASLFRPKIVKYTLPGGAYRTPEGKRVTKDTPGPSAR
jgi:hypothetical protein